MLILSAECIKRLKVRQSELKEGLFEGRRITVWGELY